MPSSNPTKTRKIEQAYRRENRVRFKRFSQDMTKAVMATQETPIINQGEFSISEAQLNSLMKGLRTRAYQDIIGVNTLANANSSVELDQTDQWQRKYLQASYLRGIETAQRQLAGFGVDVQLSLRELQELYAVGTQDDLARVLASTNTLHAETMFTLQNNALTSLVATTEKMLAQMRGVVETGNNISRTSKMLTDLRKRVSVANSNGEQTASTSTIQSFQRAQINNANITEEETGEEIKLRWLATLNDGKTRRLHRGWHGVVMTQAAASENIKESPFNCRCGFAQEPPAAYNNERRNKMFAKERKELQEEPMVRS